MVLMGLKLARIGWNWQEWAAMNLLWLEWAGMGKNQIGWSYHIFDIVCLISPNWPTGPIWSSSCKVCPGLCCPLSMQFFQGSKGGPRGAKLAFTVASVLWKKCTSRNIHHCDCQSAPPPRPPKKMLSAPFLTPAETKILVLLSASVDRFSVSRTQDFFYIIRLV